MIDAPRNAPPAPAPDGWETCTTYCFLEKSLWLLTGARCYFKAYARGPSGVYEVAKTRSFWQNTYANYMLSLWHSFIPAHPTRGARTVFAELVAELTADGWEATGERDGWCQVHFRRRLRE